MGNHGFLGVTPLVLAWMHPADSGVTPRDLVTQRSGAAAGRLMTVYILEKFYTLANIRIEVGSGIETFPFTVCLYRLLVFELTLGILEYLIIFYEPRHCGM